jgi:hypothetical protein
MAKVNVVLHGGLGNQLFQYYVSLILIQNQEKGTINLVTDYLGIYRSKREYELTNYLLEGIDHEVIQKKIFFNRAKNTKAIKKIYNKKRINSNFS